MIYSILLTSTREAKEAEVFWTSMREFNKRHFPPTASDQHRDDFHPVKIALIDTGVDIEDSLIRPAYANGRVSGRSWVGEPHDLTDTCGHGTHLARLVLKTTKSADILIAKVSQSKEFALKSRQNITEVRFSSNCIS